MAVDIVAENALTGTYTLNDMKPGTGRGDISVAGFARQISVNVGETVEFCVTGGSTIIRIFRAGWYGGVGFREIDQITNTPRTQPGAATIANSQGATSCTGWSVTATWDVPEDATSGMYMAMIRNAANNDAFYATFIVRDDDATADIIYKTSDATWGAAYNHFGTMANPDGKNVYGSGTGVGSIQERCLAGSYHRPVITRGGVEQTYWWACELPIIRFLERNGYSVKYVTSVDLDQEGIDLLDGASMFLSAGHDEYWSQPMWDALIDWREQGGHAVFMSGNEVFWRVRYEYNGDEPIMWCRKDTMPGPSGTGHQAGDPFVAGYTDWQGTWIDTRWPGRTPTENMTNTTFAGGMNGVYDYAMVIPFTGHKVWGGSALNDMPLESITINGALGFEADRVNPQGPAESWRVLAAYTRAAPGGLSDSNGENYNVVGNIQWGIASRRHESGAVTVGLGTCQWGWALDATHDRGTGAEVHPDAQQFTVNLFRDLGADPATLMSSVALQPRNSLDEYGLIPGSSTPHAPSAPRNLAFTRDGNEITLTWDAPSDEGGSPITGWTVDRGRGMAGTQNTLPAGAAPYSYTYTETTAGWIGQPDYSVSVRANNAIGNGAWAAGVYPYVEVTPEPPTAGTWYDFDGNAYAPYTLVAGVLVPLFRTGGAVGPDDPEEPEEPEEPTEPVDESFIDPSTGSVQPAGQTGWTLVMSEEFNA